MNHTAQFPNLRSAAGRRLTAWLLTIALPFVWGCRSHPDFKFDPALDQYQVMETQIEYPDVQRVEDNWAIHETMKPHSIRREENLQPWELSLEEAVQIALANSTVIRDLGGRALVSPGATPTIFQPALANADPNRGVEAALSAFDAQFAASYFMGLDERGSVNPFGGGKFKNGLFNVGISKTSAAGTSFTMRNSTNYNLTKFEFADTALRAYDTLFEGEFRHPLLQGSGIEFNRIAGPNSAPGNYNGVLLARINTDIALSDFEVGVRDFLLDIERAYWNLYFAYRDLDAKIARRDANLITWRVVRNKLEIGTEDLEREALAREQYYQSKAAVEDSLSGTVSGAAGGGGGVYTLERRLRRLLGLPPSDGRLIRPANEPIRVDVVFDWDEALVHALWRRLELRRQKWVIKQRELELTAASNFRKMRLDLVGQYRFNGFGRNLFGNDASAFRSLSAGELQGWNFGLELSAPIGNRRAHSAIRFAELNLARDKAVLREQELQVAHELADEFNELDRAFSVSKSNFNRVIAAQQQVELIQAKYEAGDVILEFVLDAQSRAADASSEFFRSLVAYNISIARLHYTKGSFLDYHKVRLAEGAWSAEAHDSALKQARRFRMKKHCLVAPCDVSQGAYIQDLEEIEPMSRFPGGQISPPQEAPRNVGPTNEAEIPLPSNAPSTSPAAGPMPDARPMSPPIGPPAPVSNSRTMPPAGGPAPPAPGPQAGNRLPPVGPSGYQAVVGMAPPVN